MNAETLVTKLVFEIKTEIWNIHLGVHSGDDYDSPF